jgi:Ca-activated chloride channel family protein
MQLRGSKFIKNINLKDVLKIAKQTKGNDKNGYRAEFISLVETVALVE